MDEKLRAVVWDLDGVIVDSAEAQNASWVAMAREYGVPYSSDKDFKIIFCRHNTDIVSSQWGITDPRLAEEMILSKEVFFRKNATNLVPLPGVVELVSALSDAGWKQAIGSSAPMENITLLLEVTRLAKYMDAIASGDHVTKGKPDPEVFLLAFQMLGVDPANGVVIEDAIVGVTAAKKAGAACIAVTNTEFAQPLLDAGADLVTSTLEGMRVGDLERLVQAQIRNSG